MSKVNGQSVADREEHVGGTHPYFFFSRGTWTCGLWPVDYTCGLWCVLVGGTHPFFLFPLEGWRNTSSPLSFWDFLKPTVLNFIIRSIQNPAQSRHHVVAHIHAATLDVDRAVILEFIPKSP